MAVAAVALLPYVYILHQRKKRFLKIELQFSDALDSLSRALRAGQTFGAGMELVASECSEPLAQELRRTCSEWKLGLAWDQALENFALRVPLLEIRLFVAAVVLQTRFGGKLNEILDELAKTIRDSLALRRIAGGFGARPPDRDRADPAAPHHRRHHVFHQPLVHWDAALASV